MTDIRSQLTKLKTPIIIGIAGDSGSGKTTYSNGIRRLLGTDFVKTITMDGYHKENRKKRAISGRLPLDPEANRLEFLQEHLGELKQGRPVEVPIYNHKTGDFDKPIHFKPSPIIIVEGLHALYPQYLPLLDFTIYVDPTREIKWEWKYKRDMEKRGHETEKLTKEMLEREAAYKKWIDFQKTNADIVIKIGKSQIKDFAKYESISKLPACCYKVELIMEPAEMKLPTIPLPFDLSSLLDINQPPFLLAAVPSLYWGKRAMVVHLDGVLSEKTVEALEKHIASLTGMSVEKMLKTQDMSSLPEHEQVTAVCFAQLLIAWRFLELINHRLTKDNYPQR